MSCIQLGQRVKSCDFLLQYNLEHHKLVKLLRKGCLNGILKYLKLYSKLCVFNRELEYQCFNWLPFNW